MPKTNAAQLKLLNVAAEIEDRRADIRDANYLAREMVLCTLPHADPKVSYWKRDAGDALLAIRTGIDYKTGKEYGIPYGTMPRLLMYWITGEVKRKGQRRLVLAGKGEGDPHSYAAFMRALGYASNTGGKNGNATRLKNAMLRLFSAEIIFSEERIYPDDVVKRSINRYSVVTEERIWWNRDDDLDTSGRGESTITLGQEMFDAIQAGAPPMDLRALMALKGSCMALDLYALLNYFGVNKPQFLAWGQLQRRLGSTYGRERDLKASVLEALDKVLLVHPFLRVEVADEKGGLEIHPSSPAIPYRDGTHG